MLGGAKKTFSKLMVNSLYGRLGMQIDDHSTLFINKEDYDFYNKNFKIIRGLSVNSLFLIEVENNHKIKNKNSRHKSNIGIAAAITSKARIKLYNCFTEIIKNNGRILYTDTDSVFAAYQRSVENEQHGDAKWILDENGMITDAVFINPKTYGVLYENKKEIIKMKGASPNKINFSKLKEKFYKNENIVVEDYTCISIKNFKAQEIKLDKTFFLGNLDKRKFIDNKKRTLPFIYEN